MEKLNFLDLHYHLAPDLYVRRHDVLSLGPILRRLGGGVYAKSHLGSTVDIATLAQKMGFPIFGSLVLNRTAGPLSYRTVLKELARRDPGETMPLLVYLPTLKAHGGPTRLARSYRYGFMGSFDLESEPLVEHGKVRDEILDLFKMGRDYGVRFASGHAHREEVFPIVDAALKAEVEGFLLTHPTQPCVGLRLSDLIELTSASTVFVEQTALTMHLGYQTEEEFGRLVREVPRVLFTSDYGQPNTPDVPDWWRNSRERFERLAISTEHQSRLFLTNALQFLGVKQ